MNGSVASLTERAAAMRDAFDRSFAETRLPNPPSAEDLLAIRIGTEPYALRLSEIAALHPLRRITPLPGSIPALRGLAGFRGAIVPVYDLATLLGHPPAEAIRWLATAASEPVAFAITAVDCHLRVARDAVIPNETGEQPYRYVREFARTTEGVAHPIVDLPSIIDAIKRLISLQPSAEGR